MSSRVWETGKQFVWFGVLMIAGILPLEGATEEAHYLLFENPDWGGGGGALFVFLG